MQKTAFFVVGVIAILVRSHGEAKAQFVFGAPENLGGTVNGPNFDMHPSISADGLSLYFMSGLRWQGGLAVAGNADIFVTKRECPACDWGQPVNLGPPVNTDGWEGEPSISNNELELYFAETYTHAGNPPRLGGIGGNDLWVTRRENLASPWGEPENLDVVNSTANDAGPKISDNWLWLFFESHRS